MKKQRFEVPADGSCLFWSVALSYLLPVIDNDEEFQNRFIKLFGQPWLYFCNSVHTLLKTYYLTFNYNDCYNDVNLKTFVSVTFRSRVIDTLRLPEVKSKCLQTITLSDFRESHNENFLTSGKILIKLKEKYRNIDVEDLDECSEFQYEDIVKKLDLLGSGDKNEFLYECYLQCMKENTCSWGGHHEIVAMSYMLQCEIEIETTSGTNVIKWNDCECKLHLFLFGTHYNFEIETKNQTDDVITNQMCNSEFEIKDKSQVQGTRKRRNDQVDFMVPVVKKQHRTSQTNNTEFISKPPIEMKYDASGLDAMFHGPMYQVKILLLYLERALTLKLNFWLACEWKEAGKFDDVVFLFYDESNALSGHFLQAKHKQNDRKKITYEELVDEKNGEFSLKKYFISYVEMKYNDKLNDVKMQSFIIFTNIDFDYKSVKSKKTLKMIETPDPMLTFDSELLNNKNPTRYHIIPNAKIKNILRKSKNSHGQNVNSSIDEFFKKLVFAVDQPNEVELGRVIEQEVGSSFNLSYNKDIADQILHDILDWFKQKQVSFITRETGNAFFENAERVFCSRVVIGLNAKLKTKLKSYSELIIFKNLRKINKVLNGHQFYLIKSAQPLLTMVNIYQSIIEHEIYKTEDNHIIINLVTLLEIKEQIYILRAFGTFANHQLLVIHCNCTDKEHKEKSIAIRTLFEKLNEVLICKIKKLLVVVDNESNLQPHIMNNQFTIENDKTNFNDLNSHSQTMLLDKSIKFQGNKIKLGELSENRSDWNEILDSECIAELIRNEQLEIGSVPLKLSQLEAAFAKRYKQIEPNNLLNAFKLDSQEPENEIFLITETVSKSASYVNRFIQLLNVINEMRKSQLINCTQILDIKSEIECKKINIVLNEKEKINEDVFKKICYYNSEKFVFWLEIVNDKFHWLQLYDPHFYIQRHFITQKPIKQENLSDLISKYACVIVRKESNERIYNLNCKIINRNENMKNEAGTAKEQNVFICDSESEAKEMFDDLCIKYKVPSSVHLIRAIDESSGNPLLKEYDYIDWQVVNEEELANTEERVVVLVAEPGMGKTTTLTRLSQYKLKDIWVIRLNLRNHQDQIKNFVDYSKESKKNSLTANVKFLLSVIHENEGSQLTAKLLKHSLNHVMLKPLLILFDGYDEISDDCRTKLMHMMKYLKENTLVKLWISSRKEHTQVLEKELGVDSTTFKELVSDEKHDYLRNFYQVRLKLQLNNNEHAVVFRKDSGPYNVFFKVLLEKVDKVFQKTLLRFMGIPLQLRLLAEGFLPEFEEFIKDNSAHINQLKFENLNVLQFYQRFISVKYDIYFQEKTRLAMEMSAECKRWLTDDLNEMHQRVAIRHLFPNRFNNLICSVEMESEQEIELLRVGILHADPFEERLEFTHRTFAEYFIAQFILHNLRKHFNGQLFQALTALLMQIITQPYQVIRMFLNEQITEEDLSFVKLENFDPTKLSALEHISKDYIKLTKFILSFFKNKIWILKQLDFSYFLRKRLFNQNEDFVKYILELIINHYDVVHRCLVHNPYTLSEQFLQGAAFEDRKSKVGMIMSAIKCYPKIIEEITRDYCEEDLCELFADDEDLCQLIRKLKHDDPDDMKMTSYEVEANELLEEFEGSDDECDSDSEFQCVHYFEHNVVGIAPYKMTRGRDLDNLVYEIDEMLRKSREDDEDDRLPQSFLEPYERLYQELKKLQRETPNLSRAKEQNIDVFHIMCSATELAKNKNFRKAEDKLKLLSHLPIASLWFDTHNNKLFQQLLSYAIKDKENTFMLFLFDWLQSDPIISTHLFATAFREYPQYTQKLIDRVECVEMKRVLSEVLSALKTSLSDDKIKKFANDLSRAFESTNHNRMRQVLYSVEPSNLDHITRWIMEQLSTCKQEFESEIVLKDVLEFLIKHGQSAIHQVIRHNNLLFLQQMTTFMKHFTKPRHSLELKYASSNLRYLYYPEDKLYIVFIFNFMWKEFPRTAACILAILVDEDLHSSLSYALKRNWSETIPLIFNVLLPYPNILKHLVLAPTPEHKTHLHLAIIECETETLEMLLSQLSRDSQVREYVLQHFTTDEENKYQLYRKVETTTTNSLLIFLNHLRLIHLQLFRTFFLPADKSVKPAFYLVGERGLKQVMDVLLRALKSEGELKWELLTWVEPASGKTVLHRAAERGYREIVDAILSSLRKQHEKLKKLFFIEDKLGHTPLDCAILSEIQIIKNDFNVELRKELIESADYITFKNHFGDEKSIECLRIISGSLMKMPMVVNLILILAKSFNSVELMMAMFENAELRLALEGMNVRREEFSYHLFYSAIERDSLELTNELIKKGYDVNCTNGYGYTPVMKTVKRLVAGITFDTSITKLLMQRGADVYFKNMNGESAHSMAWYTTTRINDGPMRSMNGNYIDEILKKN